MPNRHARSGLLIALAASAVAGVCGQPEPREVAVICRWVMYGEELDSFVFNLDANEVYWVDEDARYSITELTEGRIGFEGKRSEIRVSDAEIMRHVTIRFSINRVTGELYITGIPLPSGYDNTCQVREKML